MALIDIQVTVHIPAAWARAAVLVIVAIAVLIWPPQSELPLALGGWLGTWLGAPRVPAVFMRAAQKDAVHGG